MSTDPTAEHIDAVARAIDPGAFNDLVAGILTPVKIAACRAEASTSARTVLRSTDPAVHAAIAASLPAEVMLAALVDRGTLTEERRRLPSWGRSPSEPEWESCYATAWTEVAP